MVGHFAVHVTAIQLFVSRLEAIINAAQSPSEQVREAVEEEEEVEARRDGHPRLVATDVEHGAALVRAAVGGG